MMRYHRLGRSTLEVSKLCLGTMTFGEQNTEADGHNQLDRAMDAGINFIDTAEMYPVPARAETSGATERIIGSWLKKTGRRDKLVLATKVIGLGDWLPHIRGGKSHPDRNNIQQALEGSLKRLQTDHIDLYQIHWPDRKTNYFGKLGYTADSALQGEISIGETLAVLGDLVRCGKVRYIGISNETPWGVMEYLRLSEKLGLPRIISIQNPYSLLNRSFEVGLAEITAREQVDLLAYSPLGFGALSGKYLEKAPDKGRLSLFPQFSRYSNEAGIAATRAYVDLARKHGISPVILALAFVTSRPFTGSNIIGATTLGQLNENLDSIKLALSEEILDEIETIHARHTIPCP